MFDNIGGKIKALAQVGCWVGIICSWVVGFVLMVDKDTITMGLLVLFAGTLSSWIGSFVLYGFGELIDQITEVANNTRGSQRVLSNAVSAVSNKHTRDANTCPKCGAPISELPCPYCGGDAKDSKEPEKQSITTAENIARQHGW